VTLRDLRRATADRVAPYLLVRTGVEQSDGAGGTTYVGTDRSNSRRRVISTDLASLSADGQFAETPGDWLKNEYALLCAQPVQQRRIPEQGFAGAGTIEEVAQGFDPLLVSSPTDPCGSITLDAPFLSIVAPNLDVEIHAIPALRAGKSAGLHAHIAHATRVKLREDTVVVSGTVGQATIDVTASFPWLTTVGQFRDATSDGASSATDTWVIPGARLRFDADRVLLEPSYGSTPIACRVLRPVATWIKPAATGVWGESTVGLVDDLDQCLGDLDELSLLAAFHAADEQVRQCVVGSPEALFWAAQAQAFAARLPGLRDQSNRRARGYGRPWPDLVSVDGPLRGRFGPGFR
jgi:hypothetical protein